jgi:iron complex transport system substrate-binding protein
VAGRADQLAVWQRSRRPPALAQTIILQPDPAALTDGLDAIVKALWPLPSS